VSNAAKYAGDRARVTISADATADGGVCVSVTDDGPGFDPADADRLFHLYFRASSTSLAPGSGIGLFVSDQLVRAMGGSMSAHVVPGGGSAFTFTLPAYVDADEETVPDEPVTLPAATPDEPASVRAAAVDSSVDTGDRQQAAFARLPGIG
jgi:K+-sensing histidine kinase KdpD